MNALFCDIAVSVILFVFIAVGASEGLLQSAGGIAIVLIGIFLGRVASSKFSGPLSEILIARFPLADIIATSVATIALFYFTLVMVRFAGYFVLKLLNGVNSLPLIGNLNRFFGGIIGLGRGIILLFLLGQFLSITGLLSVNQLEGSLFAPVFLRSIFLKI